MKLTGKRVKEIRKALRCPDCTADIAVNRRTGHVTVEHDNTCPTLARVRSAGRTRQVAVSRTPGHTDEQHQAVIAAVGSLLAGEQGGYSTHGGPYEGLPPL